MLGTPGANNGLASAVISFWWVFDGVLKLKIEPWNSLFCEVVGVALSRFENGLLTGEVLKLKEPLGAVNALVDPLLFPDEFIEPPNGGNDWLI